MEYFNLNIILLIQLCDFVFDVLNDVSNWRLSCLHHLIGYNSNVIIEHHLTGKKNFTPLD